MNIALFSQASRINEQDIYLDMRLVHVNAD